MRKKKKNKQFFNIGWNTLFLAVFFGMIAFKTYDLQKINRELEQQVGEYSKKIEVQNEERDSLLEEKEYSQSDIYVEKIAREKLGLVKEDEIVFMQQNKEGDISQ